MSTHPAPARCHTTSHPLPHRVNRVTNSRRADADSRARLAAELLDATAEELRWEVDNLRPLSTWLERLGALARDRGHLELLNADRATLQARWLEFGARAEGALTDASVIAGSLRDRTLPADSPEVDETERRLADAVDDAVRIAADARPLLGSLVRWRLRLLASDLELARTRVMQALPRAQRERGVATLTTVEQAAEGLSSAGRLRFNLEDGAAVERAMLALEHLSRPLDAWAALARLSELGATLFDTRGGAIRTALEGALAAEPATGDPTRSERAARAETTRGRAEAVLERAALATREHLDQALAAGAAPSAAAACAAGLRRTWVDAWAALREVSRALVPMSARSRLLDVVDETLKDAVTRAARCERALGSTGEVGAAPS